MSCRVLGLEVELAVLNEVIDRAQLPGEQRVVGVIHKMPNNQPCWDLFSRLGFIEGDEGIWTHQGGFGLNRHLRIPVHVDRNFQIRMN